MREFFQRLAAVGRRGRRDADLDDELRFHVEALTRDYEKQGMVHDAARAAALRELGGVERTRQSWRDQRSWLPLEELLQDVRYGWRVLRRSRGLTVLAAAMLALAVGSTTSLFTVVDAVLLAPLPYAKADQLLVLTEEYITQHAPNVSVTPGNFLEWQDRSRTIAAMTAIDMRQQNLTGDGDPQHVVVGAVSRGFAPTVGVQPETGRLFADDEFEPGRENIALISHSLWVERYGGGAVLGRSIVLDDRPYTIVGVMPPQFLFPAPAMQLWVPFPLTAADRENRTGHTLAAVARMRDGVTVATASRELHAIAETLRRDFPASNKEWGITVTPAREALVGQTSDVLLAMVGAVVLLLLVACANIAGLLLTHGVSRSRELAIRSALGATRVRVVRQLFTESVLLAIIGAGAGVGVAWLSSPLLAALRPANLLTWKPVALDTRALVFSAVTAVGAGILFGVLPAFVASRTNIGAAASERSEGVRSSRIRQALVAAEVALAVVLVAGAALFGRTLATLTAVDLGFQPDSLVTVQSALPQTRYGDVRRVDQFHRELFDRLRALPGVRAAGAIQLLPLSGNTSVRPYVVDGAPATPQSPVAHYRIVTPGYLEAMRIPLRAGRTFTDADTADRPLVAIVNETLGRQGWGGVNPIGRRITFGGGSGPDVKWAEVVGVVGDVRHFGAGTPPVAEMYWADQQVAVVKSSTLDRMRRQMTLVVSVGRGDPLSVVPSIRAAVQAVDPDQPIASVRTMASLADQSMWLPRASAWLLSIFGTSALVFALLGVFGAASYGVAQRRRELAVRIALGAESGSVTRLVLGGALRAAAVGIIGGLALVVALGKSISTLLVGVKATDPLTLAAVGVALAGATAAVSYLPARRAARIDPIQALRTE
ncbi:MAG TPA: ABC transporter permease [Vicinamibacterales bacterium]|nr:ABC transporter permease [Vicinamibacterales bacterium]